MAATSSRKRRRGPRLVPVLKPNGKFQPRVQKVGPDHFGIVSIDPAKGCSKWMLADFYGNMLVAPTEISHRQSDFVVAIDQIRQTLDKHQIKDQIVAIERTGRYHAPVKAAFTKAGWECRMVHPFASKQFRQPDHAGDKTDETDLVGIHRAAVNGFGLIELPGEPKHDQLRLLARFRRDLVYKRSTLCCQIQEHLDATMPGYAACFSDLWQTVVPLTVARHADSAQHILRLGVAGLAKLLRDINVRFRTPTLEHAVAWAQGAAAGAEQATLYQRMWTSYYDDYLAKTQEITGLEQDMAHLLVQTPYMLLLSIPGINIVSAAEFAGEMGPIQHYPNAKAITGRTGLFPSRYQSNQVDRDRGPLVRRANRRLRNIIMLIADNLMRCNNHFRILATQWKIDGKDARHSHVKVASRFCRIAFQMVAGGQVFRHRSCRERSYMLEKLLAFHRQHDTPMREVLVDLKAATEYVPKEEYRHEAKPLADQLDHVRSGRVRRKGITLLADILPEVLAKLGVPAVESKESGESDSTAANDACADERR